MGALVVAGMRTGLDVQCNGADAVARLPGGAPVSVVGLAAVGLGPQGGAFVLANGTVVVAAPSDAEGCFSPQLESPAGRLPPSSRYTVACAVDVNADGTVDVVLGGATGSPPAVLLAAAGAQGFSVDSGALGAALASAIGLAGVHSLAAVVLGPGCPLGVTLVAASPSAVLMTWLATNGSFVVSTSVANSGGVAGVAFADISGDGTVDAVSCTNTTGALLVAAALCDTPGFVVVGSLPGPCSGVGLGDIDGDGDVDAFVTGATGVANSLWLNDGQGRFSVAAGIELGVGPSAPVLVDVNGDGRCVCACTG